MFTTAATPPSRMASILLQNVLISPPVLSSLNFICTEAISYLTSSLIASSQPFPALTPSPQPGLYIPFNMCANSAFVLWYHNSLPCSSLYNSWCFLYFSGSCWAPRPFQEMACSHPQSWANPFRCRAQAVLPRVHHLVLINSGFHLPLYSCST